MEKSLYFFEGAIYTVKPNMVQFMCDAIVLLTIYDIFLSIFSTHPYIPSGFCIETVEFL